MIRRHWRCLRAHAAPRSSLLALDIADVAELPLTLTTTAKESLDRACAAGFGDADFACLARLLRPED